MATLDKNIEAILKDAGLGMDAVWMHKQSGKYIMYHWACEKAAAKKGIAWETPQVIQACAKDKIAVILVAGKLGDKTEWSFGEAAPYNTTQTYPFAMAEKRAKDRVILKLIGLHGDVYSEEEADDFKNRPAPEPAQDSPANSYVTRALADIASFGTNDALTTWATVNKPHIEALPDDLQEKIRNAYRRKFNSLKEAA